MTENLSDKELMMQVKTKDTNAFEKLFARYKKPIYNFILRRVKDHHTAEDIFQETFLRVFRYAKSYKKNYAFSSWLYQIARNLCIDELNLHKEEPNHEVEVDTFISSIQSAPQRAIELVELEELIQKAIDCLTLEQREVFLLREEQKLSYEEIAKIIDCSVSAVKSRLHRARMALKSILKPYLKSGKLSEKLQKAKEKNDEL